MALQAQDQRSKWSSSNNVAFRPTYSLSPFVAKSTTTTTNSSTCDIRDNIKYSDNSFSRQRHFSGGKKRKSRSSLKSRSTTANNLTTLSSQTSPYSQPPTLQPHFIHQVRRMSSNLTNLYFLMNQFSSQFYKMRNILHVLHIMSL